MARVHTMRSMVPICAVQYGAFTGCGTGFAIGSIDDGTLLVVTARHVVEPKQLMGDARPIHEGQLDGLDTHSYKSSRHPAAHSLVVCAPRRGAGAQRFLGMTVRYVVLANELYDGLGDPIKPKTGNRCRHAPAC